MKQAMKFYQGIPVLCRNTVITSDMTHLRGLCWMASRGLFQSKLPYDSIYLIIYVHLKITKLLHEKKKKKRVITVHALSKWLQSHLHDWQGRNRRNLVVFWFAGVTNPIEITGIEDGRLKWGKNLTREALRNQVVGSMDYNKPWTFLAETTITVTIMRLLIKNERQYDSTDEPQTIYYVPIKYLWSEDHSLAASDIHRVRTYIS